MLTVPEAARRVARDPETVRRWIRSGRLRARKVGTQHVIDENDFDQAIEKGVEVDVPPGVAGLLRRLATARLGTHRPPLP